MSEAPRSARIRLRSIRYKDGRAQLRVLYPPEPFDYSADAAKRCQATIQALADEGSNIAGYALVVWAGCGKSAVSFAANDASAIPSILIPDFVRNRLLAERIESWTLSGMEEDADG